MQIRNNIQRYGMVNVCLHWLVAFTVFGMFGLGYYMVGLGYYDPWYRSAPDIHRSIGVLLFMVVIFRLVWRLLDTHPQALVSHRRFEIVLARIAHFLLYGLMLVVMISGYLISTADGSSVRVFDWFEVPSATGRVRNLEDSAGEVHYWSTWTLVVLAGLHGLAAVKHHLIDRDNTLRRMLPVQLKK
ncbi:cytochrome b [uncultured Marinobacter sp.]|uniref:cytochrome b n=1 Tax=uncultured Marinobacter sp. TaxID=187379 RepID=UPI0030DA458A